MEEPAAPGGFFFVFFRFVAVAINRLRCVAAPLSRRIGLDPAHTR
jgi:hypothetical protein